MKKLKLKLEGVKEMLTKTQMKKVVGGYGDGDAPPPEPTGTEDSFSGSGYRCCWTGTSTCSVCVARATSSWLCVNGASLTAC